MEGLTEPGSREEIQAPEGAYQPDRRMVEADMEFEEISAEIREEETQYGSSGYADVKGSETEPEEAPESAASAAEEGAGAPENSEEAEMGLGGMFKRKKSDYDEFAESVLAENGEEMEEGADGSYEEPEEEPVEEKPRRKPKKPAPKKKKRSLLPMLLILAIALLGGGGYMAWEMLSSPAPVAQYKPPVKPKLHPQEKKAQTAKPAARPQQAGSPLPAQGSPAPVSATDLVAMEIAGMGGQQPTAVVDIIERKPGTPEDNLIDKKPQPKQGMPSELKPRAGGEEGLPGGSSLENLERKIDEISRELSEIRVSLDYKNKVNPGASSPLKGAQGVDKSILQDMTGEIQGLAAKNKALTGELTAAKGKISELREKIAKLEKQGKAEKKPEKKAEKKGGSSEQAQGSTNGWEILGFSGNRVVIADERGTHVINVGQSFNGVKVLAVDVESGAVKTSAGTLKYGN